MRIKKIRIQNLRAINDTTIDLDDYTCFVGSNGVGKSTVLGALNIFVRETENAATNLSQLDVEDFHLRDVSRPIEITVTFGDLTADEQAALSDYYRQDQLIVTARAEFDTATGNATVVQFGSRMAMPEFAPYFAAMKNGAKAADLKAIFVALREQFPDIESRVSKDDMAASLNAYEATRPDLCAPIPSEDQFYGVGQVGKLRPFVQWIYIPAVKDASEEQAEARNTALGRLLARTVRARVNFAEQLQAIKAEAEGKYRELIEAEQGVLDEVSRSLQERLVEWSTPHATARLSWHQDPKSAIRVEEPLARLTAGDGHFEGNIARFGHGMQRSYLIALLQGLASLEEGQEPKLILGCEEPELYQHPPQARHLASVLQDLAENGSQVVLTSHSPLFVDGRGFEAVRLVQKDATGREASVRRMSLADLSAALAQASGAEPRPVNATLAKLHQALQPALAEMFFTTRLILVEGLEDEAYITAWLRLTDRWSEFRKAGCHIVPVGGKSEIARPLAIAKGLHIPVFTLFDADGNKLTHTDPNTAASRRQLHETDNLTIMRLLEAPEAAFPAETVWGDTFAIWPTDLEAVLRAEVGGVAWDRLGGAATRSFDDETGLKKNSLHIAERLSQALDANVKPATLEQLCQVILTFATAAPQQLVEPVIVAV